jgi:chorismate mutase
MSESDLSAFRQEIDAIDAELHALIVRRAEVSEKVRAIKTGDDLKLRPGREANILRALAARHVGAFPKPQLVRIWREILTASLAMQGPFSVAIYATETAHSFWDLARDHFGGGVQNWKFGTTRRVVETVVSGQCTVGILPEPDPQDVDPWWQYLLVQPNAANQGRPIRVIAKLPFARAGAQHGGAEAVIVARAEAEPSGNDRSLIAIDLAADYSTDMLLTEVAACGFTGAFLRSKWHDPSERKRWVHLVETDGFLAADDPRIADAKAVFDKNLNEIIVVGGFAEPLVLDDQTHPVARAR